MRDSEHQGTFQIITAIVITIVLALLLWNLTIRDVGATPLDRTCYVYPVTLRHVSCVLHWCQSWEDIYVNGQQTLGVRVSGWNLKNGQIKFVNICR